MVFGVHDGIAGNTVISKLNETFGWPLIDPGAIAGVTPILKLTCGRNIDRKYFRRH